MDTQTGKLGGPGYSGMRHETLLARFCTSGLDLTERLNQDNDRMTMKNDKIDWTSFRKRIIIGNPPGEVYNCWATKSNIENWFLEKAEYYSIDGKKREPDEQVERDDSFNWKWNNWEFEEKGKILIANGKDQISFTFGRGGNVHVYLKEKNGATEMTLIQDNIPDDEKSRMDLFVGCATGWTFWMANLKAWLEHGITLHATGLAQSDTTDLVNS